MAKRNSNRLLYILAGVAILLIIVAVIGKKQGWIGKEQQLQVTAAKAKKSTIVEKVSASGKVQPETEVKISPDVSGEIIELKVEEGDSVVKGQLLLKIKPDNYESMVEMQEASVNTQRANLAQAKSRYAQTKANNMQAKLTHQRNIQLYKDKVISQAEFETSQANFAVSNQEIESALQSIKAAEFGVQSAQAQLKEARENLGKTIIYAPVSGTISKLAVEKGERVVGTSQMAGTELLRIANLRSMEVRVDVNENDIVRVTLGDSVQIEVDSYAAKDQKFKGIVTSIANTAKDAVSLEAVTEFEVRIRILNDSYKELLAERGGRSPFRPGMTASVDIITERKTNVLTVPLAAVTTRLPDDGKKKDKKSNFGPRKAEVKSDAEKKAESAKADVEEVVFVHSGGKVKQVKVKTGISDLDNIEISEGLKEGDEVVTGPFRAVSKQLEDGKAVAVTDEGSLDKKALNDEKVEVEID